MEPDQSTDKSMTMTEEIRDRDIIEKHRITREDGFAVSKTGQKNQIGNMEIYTLHHGPCFSEKYYKKMGSSPSTGTVVGDLKVRKGLAIFINC